MRKFEKIVKEAVKIPVVFTASFTIFYYRQLRF